MESSANCLKVVLGLIPRQNKLLIAVRPNHKPFGGYHEFPGGKVEKEESYQEALYREIKEEVGLIIKQSHLYYKWQQKNCLFQAWWIDEFQCEPKNLEGQLLFWLPQSQLTTLNMLPANEVLIKRLVKS